MGTRGIPKNPVSRRYARNVSRGSGRKVVSAPLCPVQGGQSRNEPPSKIHATPTRAGLSIRGMKTERYEVLDGLRGLLALFVVVNHCLQFVEQAPEFSALPSLAFLRNLGSLSVPIFIVLSGFVICLPMAQGRVTEWGKFFQRRAWRILPVFYVCFLASLGAALWAGDISKWEILGGTPIVLAPLFLLHDVWGGVPTNEPLWSMAVEWHIYFFIPLLMWAWRKYGVVSATLGAVAVCWIAQGFANWFIGDNVRFYLYALFALGAGSAWFFCQRSPMCLSVREYITRPAFLALTALLTGSLIFGVGRSANTAAWMYPASLAGLWSCCLVLALCDNGLPGMRKLLNSSPLQKIGAASYSLYASHWVVLVVLRQSFPAFEGIPSLSAFVGLWVVAFPACLLVAGLLHILVERPLRTGYNWRHAYRTRGILVRTVWSRLYGTQ